MINPREMVADHSTHLTTNRNSHADRVHCRNCSNKQGGTVNRRHRPTEPHPGRAIP